METSAASVTAATVAAAAAAAELNREKKQDRAEEDEGGKGGKAREDEILSLRRSNADLISQMKTLAESQVGTVSGVTKNMAGLPVDKKEPLATTSTVSDSDPTNNTAQLPGKIENAVVTTGAAADVSTNAAQVSDQSATTTVSTAAARAAVTNNDAARIAGEKEQEAKREEEERAFREAGVTRVVQGLRAENARLRTRLLAAEAAAKTAEQHLRGTLTQFPKRNGNPNTIPPLFPVPTRIFYFASYRRPTIPQTIPLRPMNTLYPASVSSSPVTTINVPQRHS